MPGTEGLKQQESVSQSHRPGVRGQGAGGAMLLRVVGEPQVPVSLLVSGGPLFVATELRSSWTVFLRTCLSRFPLFAKTPAVVDGGPTLLQCDHMLASHARTGSVFSVR